MSNGSRRVGRDQMIHAPIQTSAYTIRAPCSPCIKPRFFCGSVAWIAAPPHVPAILRHNRRGLQSGLAQMDAALIQPAHTALILHGVTSRRAAALLSTAPSCHSAVGQIQQTIQPAVRGAVQCTLRDVLSLDGRTTAPKPQNQKPLAQPSFPSSPSLINCTVSGAP